MVGMRRSAFASPVMRGHQPGCVLHVLVGCARRMPEILMDAMSWSAVASSDCASQLPMWWPGAALVVRCCGVLPPCLRGGGV